MVELHNLRRLHTIAREKVIFLEERIMQMRDEYETRIKALESKLTEQQNINADLRLQLEELRIVVFGKKRKKEEPFDVDDNEPPRQNITNHRSSESYRRAIPKENEVTDTKEHPIDSCNHCGGNISEREIVTYFVEDIPLPQKKMVVKHLVEKGYCDICKRWSTKEPLPSTSVIVGPNVRRYVTYLSTICRQSYGQIQVLLEHSYNIDISQGEIAKILDKEGEHLRPEYERLKASIRSEPSIHLDETGWNLLGYDSKTYAWTMTGGESFESVFVLGKTRGKGNATDLLGDSKAVVVSDDYGAYRKLENPHQLCCAHPNRKLRDLAGSSEIIESIRNHCVSAYKTFKKIYADIEKARKSNNPKSAHDSLYARLKSFAISNPSDPDKLVRIKKQISERTGNYLTCLLHPKVASDNNAAERSLRHLVLKRKISFGSFSEKTAETLAILCSVLMSYKQRGEMGAYLRGV